MDIEIRHLKLMKAVAEEGGITRAGHRLHLTQSALSHQLRDIEENLGTPLFLRLNKKMVLTEAGERLLNSAHAVLDELRRTEEDIRRITSDREGILRVSTACYTCYHWLPPLLIVFNERFPRVEVRIVVEATRRPIEALLDGKLDLAIVSERLRNRKLSFKPLFQDEMVVIMRPDHRLAAQPFVCLQDFAEENLIIYSSPGESYVLRKVLAPAGVSPRQVSQIQLTEAIVEMVKAGLGISLLARWSVASHIKSGALRALPLTSKGFHRQWSAAIMRNKIAPPYLQAFVKLLSDRAMLSVQVD